MEADYANVYEYNGWMYTTDYEKLIKIARENNILTTNINDIIIFMIRNFPSHQK